MNPITLYHGSTIPITTPQLLKSKRSKDFNQGFYCTNLYQQAERWALRRKEGVVSVYQYLPNPSLNILSFDSMTESWLDFIIACRTHYPHTYDIVEGPMADDQVFLTADDLINGSITREQFWIMVKFRYTTHQISFHTEQALETLTYLENRKVVR